MKVISSNPYRMYKSPIDGYSLLLCGTAWYAKFLIVNSAAFDLKVLLEVFGSISVVSTIVYNMIKTYGEIARMFNKFRSRKRKKKDYPKNPFFKAPEEDNFD